MSDRYVGVITGIVAVRPRDTLNVRTAPDVNMSRVLTKLDNGAEVTVQGEEMNAGTKWLLINAGNLSGWVRADYIKLTDAAPCPPEKEKP